jgi:hypothetical protein
MNQLELEFGIKKGDIAHTPLGVKEVKSVYPNVNYGAMVNVKLEGRKASTFPVEEVSKQEIDELWRDGFETGATCSMVNNAMICLPNTGELHPFLHMDQNILAESAKKYASVTFAPGSKELEELHRLWNSFVDDWLEDAHNNGYNPYDGCDIELDDTKAAIISLKADGNCIKLPSAPRFTKECYARVKKILQDAGGKYTRNTFKFQSNAAGILERLLDGELINDKKKFQQFYTPAELVNKMQERVCVLSDSMILEPSAGQGALLDGIEPTQVHVCEIDPTNRQHLEDHGYTIVGDDFLEYNSGPKYDIILANPPFTKNQDVKHVKHMYEMLMSGGTLVSIMSNSWRTGQQRLQKDFREWLSDQESEVEDIPAGIFKGSGTGVATCMVTINKR